MFEGTTNAPGQTPFQVRRRPDLVFGADHVDRMAVHQMIDFYLERQADLTLAALPVPRQQSAGFASGATGTGTYAP